MKAQVPQPSSGGLILSYKCSAECRHCIYGCSPRWSGDFIPESDLARILEQLAGLIEPSYIGPDRVDLSSGLHFTGGEPLLNFKLLCRAVELAAELQIPSTFVETNSFWAFDDKTAREKLSTLKELGLKGLMVSVNPFYLEYVPLERTERAIRLGQEIFGPNLMVYQLEYFRRFKGWGLTDKVPFEDYLKLEGREDFARRTEFFLMGRAPSRLAATIEKFLPRRPAAGWLSRPCSTPFMRDWHNHFDNYANYVPGFCGGISYGDARELDTLLAMGVDLDQRPVLALLMSDDFKGLFEFAVGHGFEPAPEGYFSKCHLCQELRTHLVEVGDFAELQPREFYDHLG